MTKSLAALKEKYLALLNGTNTSLSMEELLLFNIVEKELKKGKKAQLKLKALGNFVLKSKALEIIKNKRVNVYWLLNSRNVVEHNNAVYQYWQKLTQEEYDFLKKVML